MRKTKEECLDSLPTIIRSEYNIEVSEVDKIEYDRLKTELSGQAKAAYSVKGRKDAETNALQLLSAIRTETSGAKVDGAVKLIREKFASGHSNAVIFTWFRETAFKLKGALLQGLHQSSISTMNPSHQICLSCEVLCGETHIDERQRLVDSFQADQLQVLVCTFGVGATGLTLTRSRLVILLDRPWTPGDVMQAEDRVRRIGQSAAEVESVWISGFDFDRKLDDMLLKKLRCAEKVLATSDNRGHKEYDGKDKKKGRAQESKDWFSESSVASSILKSFIK